MSTSPLTDAQRGHHRARRTAAVPRDRAAFLEAVAARLGGVEVIGDGNVARIVREMQRQFSIRPRSSTTRAV